MSLCMEIAQGLHRGQWADPQKGIQRGAGFFHTEKEWVRSLNLWSQKQFRVLVAWNCSFQCQSFFYMLLRFCLTWLSQDSFSPKWKFLEKLFEWR